MAPARRKWSTIATPSAPPSVGSVPAPTSSSSTSAGSARSLRHLDDRRQVCGEGGQALRDRLLVADVGIDAPEHRQPAAGRRRHVEPALRHEREEPDALERHRLAAGVGAGDHEHPVLAAEPQAHRHGLRRALDPEPRRQLRHQQRMAGVDQLELGPRALEDLRRVRVHRDRQQRHRLDRVELAERRGHRLDRGGARADAGGELLQDAHDLAPLGVLQLDDVVVELDRRQRLDEQARARARAAVDDAGELAPLLGLQQQHVAVVARRDDAVLQQPLALGAPEVALHHARELGAQPQQRAPQLGEPGRGVVAELARRQERPADRDRDRASCPRPGRRAARARARRPRAPRDARSRRRPRRTRPGRRAPAARGGCPARGRRRALRASRADRGRAGGPAAAGASTALARPGQGPAHGLGLDERVELLEANPSHSESPPAAAGAPECGRTPVS